MSRQAQLSSPCTSTMAWGIYDGMGYELSLVCNTCVCAQSMSLERGANRELCVRTAPTGCSVETFRRSIRDISKHRFHRRILGDSFVCMLTCNPKFNPH
jgi:hypothetical protein